jgi:hypothetical protein
MTKIWRRPPERTIEKQLPKRRAEQVRAAHHFGDLHDCVIDHDGELVSRNVVFPPDDEITKRNSPNGALRPGAMVDKLQRFAFRNAETPVHASRIFNRWDR